MVILAVSEEVRIGRGARLDHGSHPIGEGQVTRRCKQRQQKKAEGGPEEPREAMWQQPREQEQERSRGSSKREQAQKQKANVSSSRTKENAEEHHMDRDENRSGEQVDQ